MHAYATTLLRLALGTMTLAHGLMKLLVFTPAGTVSYFQSLGFPAALAYLTMTAEIGGGLALLAGIYTRWVSLALIPLLLGAASVHWGNGWVFSNAGGGWEFPVFWAVILLVQAGLGGGRWVVSRQFA